MINADFSRIIRVYHNHLRHLRSIVFVVYYFRVTLTEAHKCNRQSTTVRQVQRQVGQDFSCSRFFAGHPIFSAVLDVPLCIPLQESQT